MIRFDLMWPDGNDWAWMGPALAIWVTVLGVNLIAETFKEATVDNELEETNSRIGIANCACWRGTKNY